MSTPTTFLRIPASTYRLQFNRHVTFVEARKLVAYLHDLGITDCYCSSYLMATPGSLHGYDIVDPTSLNPEIGTEEEFRAFSKALKDRGMGQILDIVPNHMGIEKGCNPWWLDVMENGQSSHYSDFFDIAWSPIESNVGAKVVLPILSNQYGTVLENQDITVVFDEGAFSIRYWDNILPLTPESYVNILTHRLPEFVKARGAKNTHAQELQSIITAITHLPQHHEREPDLVAERYREKAIIKGRLVAVTMASRHVRAFIEDNVQIFNGKKGDPESFNLLDALLGEQVYRLAYWRVASEEINYRRFFDINSLAALRMEDPHVFQEVHRLIFALLRDGAVTGLRVDHVDGLYDPGDYLRQLQSWAKTELVPRGQAPLFLIVEKVLSRGETLPDEWPVHGTTGYDFLFLLNNLFIDRSNKRAFNELYSGFAKVRVAPEDLVYHNKKLIMHAAMASEINVLGYQLKRLAEKDRQSRDFTLNSLTNTIREIIACFPVYRTYVTESQNNGISERDRAYIRLAVARAKRRNPALSNLLFDFVRELLLKHQKSDCPETRQEQTRFAMKFQQTTSPVMAKGVEDTAFYTYNRLVSLNEVGADIDQFGISAATFHDRMRERQKQWPHALSATSTHDTKRSEDVRARVNALSELPLEWRACLRRWHTLNKGKKRLVHDQPAPDRNDEVLLYQSLVGVWPFESMDASQYRVLCDRIQRYMAKATREAKVHTSWVNPHEEYDEAVRTFVEAILDRSEPNAFLDDLLPFQARIAQYGIYNSLSQVVFKIAAPGVPDFYQGTEFWDLSLVDPDNRRLVDFKVRKTMLSELRHAVRDAGQNLMPLMRELVKTRADGRIKLYVTMTALHFRRSHASLFRNGEYIPVHGIGENRDYTCAFARRYGEESLIAVIPGRIVHLLSDAMKPPLGSAVWGETWLALPFDQANSRYRNIFTNEVLTSTMVDGQPALSLASVFGKFPVALLERIASSFSAA